MATHESRYPQICKDILNWTKTDTFKMWSPEKQKLFLQVLKEMCDQYRTGRVRSPDGDTRLLHLSAQLLRAKSGKKKSKKRRRRFTARQRIQMKNRRKWSRKKRSRSRRRTRSRRRRTRSRRRR